jgi:hypothetical protein
MAVTVGGVLVSHAGLTVGAWRTLADGTSDPEVAAAALNATMLSDPPGPLGSGGRLTGGPTRADVGCVWAEVCLELADPWLAEGRMPFSQVHGHASVFNWAAAEFWSDTTAHVRVAADVDEVSGGCRVRVGDTELLSVDNGLVDAAGVPYPVVVLDDGS